MYYLKRETYLFTLGYEKEKINKDYKISLSNELDVVQCSIMYYNVANIYI